MPGELFGKPVDGRMHAFNRTTNTRGHETERGRETLTLALCMIVKNEASVLSQCLESVCGLIDEIIIVDTGSDDKTVEIGRRFGARIFFKQWNNDFSQARNVSLEKADSDWILVLDADETISQNEHRNIRNLIKNQHALGFELEQRTYGNNPNFKNWIQNTGAYPEEKGYGGFVRSPLIRLFKNDDRIRFANPVHELVEPSFTRHGLPYLKTSIPIHHYGKVRGQARLEEKARLYLEIGKKKAAADPMNPKALSELGAQYLEMKAYAEAVSIFQQIETLQPDNPDIKADLGAALLRQGKFEAAEAALQRAVSLFPDHTDALFNLGAVFLKQGRYVEAESVFSHILEIQPAHGNAHAALGSAYLCINRIEEAVLFLQKAIRLNPGDADAHSNLGWAFVRMGLSERARAYGRKAIDIDPKHANANRMVREAEAVATEPRDNEVAGLLNRKGEDLFAQNRLIAAGDCFKAACKNNPQNGQAWNNLGVFYWRTNEKDQALASLLRAYLLQPNDPDVSENLSGSCTALNKTMLQNLLKDPDMENILALEPRHSDVC